MVKGYLVARTRSALNDSPDSNSRQELRAGLRLVGLRSSPLPHATAFDHSRSGHARSRTMTLARPAAKTFCRTRSRKVDSSQRQHPKWTAHTRCSRGYLPRRARTLILPRNLVSRHDGGFKRPWRCLSSGHSSHLTPRSRRTGALVDAHFSASVPEPDSSDNWPNLASDQRAQRERFLDSSHKCTWRDSNPKLSRRIAERGTEIRHDSLNSSTVVISWEVEWLQSKCSHSGVR